MAGQLKRASLVPDPASAAPAAPVGEFEAIPALDSSLLARPTRNRANDASTDILYAKGTATTSRWRGYDHKEAFQPAQRATAPPSDADQAGSWVKYDGSVPVATALDQAVRDEELPTSWYKYEAKPFASLLEKRELRPKAPIYLADSAPPAPEHPAQPEAAAETPVVPAEPPTSEVVRALNPEAEAKTEIPAAPLDQAAAEVPEAVLLPPALSVDPIGVPAKLERSGAAPSEATPAAMPEPQPAPATPVEEPPVLVAQAEPMPMEEASRSDVSVEPEVLAPAVTADEPEEPALGPDPTVETRAPVPAAETAIEATASAVEPSDEHELARVAAAAIKTPNPAKKAMLSRLADLLERALSAKRSAHDPAAAHVAPALEESAPSSGLTARPADAMQSEAFLPPQPVSPPLPAQTEAEATELAAPEITRDPVVPAEVAIDPVPLAAIAEASPVAPEAPALEVSTEIETAAPATFESAPAEIAASSPSLDLDEPSRAPDVPPEAGGIAEPIPALSDEVVTSEAEPTPEPEAPLVSPPSPPPLPAAALQIDAAEPEAFLEPPAEPADAVGAIVAAAPLADVSPEFAPPPEVPVVAPEVTTEAPADATEQPEIGISQQEPWAADLEPPPVYAQEQPAPGDEAAPDAPSEVPSAEDPVPIAAGEAEHAGERASEPDPEAAAPIEVAPLTQTVAEELAPAPIPLAAAAPIDEERTAQEALASDLADMIHNVLSTTQFATKTLKPGRYIPAQSAHSTDEPEPADLDGGSGIAADALPHPVAIRSRLSRMERVVAFASLGMMILVGYFVMSLWRDDGVSARAPVIVAAPVKPAAPLSKDWGERARDVTRELGATAIDPSKTSSSIPQPLLPNAADARQAKPRSLQGAP